MVSGKFRLPFGVRSTSERIITTERTKATPREFERRCFDLPWGRVAVARVDEELFAVGDECTHAGCSLSEGYLTDGEDAVVADADRIMAATAAEAAQLVGLYRADATRIRVRHRDVHHD